MYSVITIQFCYSFMLNFTPTQYKFITVKPYNKFILLSQHQIPTEKFVRRLKNNLHTWEEMHYNNWNEGGGGGREGWEQSSTCWTPKWIKILWTLHELCNPPRPLSRDHFCENLASILFHSSAGERLQFNEVNLLMTEFRKRVCRFHSWVRL